ncbi:DNA-binding response regulator [Bradyrhizobium sp. SK17]|jgi:DNA-binding NarL/FixJ family response regulator|uniref:response regulator transcription factor n=1 Tax=Bradyrhizobium sp. SK17 TaxID=2057741 RepID=UPI000C300256|nr:response regulator transcription factor [Bradyrhizobium sp. SK17]AUC97995.1 DNA-binding response regulator [Bradyrhizobium sp. SK17]
MPTILFVDDHPIYRDGLQRLLAEIEPGLTVCTASGYAAALELLNDNRDIDFVLADRRLSDGDGISLLQDVRRQWPDVAIGLLCADLTPEVAIRMRQLGGVACLSKERSANSLQDAIGRIFDGQIVFDLEAQSAPLDVLPARQWEVVTLARDGQSDKQIADRLKISENTVRMHWRQIFIRLDANNRTAAVAKAIQSGLI